MVILTWEKDGYVVNYTIDEGCTVVLSSGKASDKKALLKEAEKQLRTYSLKGK